MKQYFIEDVQDVFINTMIIFFKNESIFIPLIAYKDPSQTKNLNEMLPSISLKCL